LQPHLSKIKCNFDEASKGNLGLASNGGIFQNSNGGFYCGFVVPLGISSSLLAELLAAVTAIEFAHAKGWRNLWL